MAGDLIHLFERIARAHAVTTLDEIAQRRAAVQERAAREAVRPHSSNVIPLGPRRPPFKEVSGEL